MFNSAFINICWISQSRNNFQLSGQNNVGLRCFCSSLRCDWPRKLAPLSHLIRFWEAKTNRDLVFRVFPRSRKRAWFNSKYRSILIGFLWYLSLVWLAGLIISVGFLRLKAEIRTISNVILKLLAWLIPAVCTRLSHTCMNLVYANTVVVGPAQGG